MLLTIAIPTYNRAERLRSTLLSFVAQIDQALLTEVEIVVSDNCSTDATPEVCADIASANPTLQLRYFRNITNLGFDGNVNALFAYATGRYVWTFSDDDQPSEQVLTRLMDLLRLREIKFAFINYQVRVDGQTLPSRFGAGSDFWLPAQDLLKTIRFSNSLISSCLFSRRAWLNANPTRYLGSLWIHFYMAREVVQSGECLIVGDPMFTMTQSSLEVSRAEKRIESSGRIEYYMQAYLKYIEYVHQLPRYSFDIETCTLAQSMVRGGDLNQIISFKLTVSRYELRQLVKIWRRLLVYRSTALSFWLLTTPLLFVPNGFFKVLRALRRLVRL